MVVNGGFELVGNDSRKALQTIERAAHSSVPAPVIHVERAGNSLHLSVTGAGKHGLNVLCAITENNLSTAVRGGENHGHELHHAAVVRQLTKLGSTRDGRFQADFPLKFASDWRPENLRAVVFLQNGSAGEILSAVQIALSPPTN